jgi:hypothetical protein
LASSSTSTTEGTSITLTATVSPTAATGTVAFYDGSASLGSATLSSGTATLSASFSTTGTHTLTATYAGSSTYTTSTSGSVSVTVTASTTTSSTASSCGLQDSTNSAYGTALDAYSSGTHTLTSPTLDATDTDESAICAQNSGTTIAVTSPTITTSGATGNVNDSSFYGLNAAVLAYGSSSSTSSGGSITLTNGSITTSGQGANGVFASGDGATITISGTTISATGANAHGLDAAYGGTLKITDVTATTTGASSSVLATDRGGGTVTVSGGTYTASGYRSAGIYSTGAVTVTNGTFTANDAEAAVVEGSNSLTLSGTALVSSDGDDRGVFIYQSTSGDAASGSGTFTMTNGSITYSCATTSCSEGATASGQNNPATMFSVANTTAVISLTDVTITNNVATLLTAEALNSGTWGTSGSNGGLVTFTADGTTLTGNVIVDDISTLALSLTNSSSLTGAINTANTGKNVALTLDSTSTWNVTAKSYLTKLSGETISGTTITNIVGGGYDVYYVSADNSALGGKTYTLSGTAGGQLIPD